VPFGFVYFIYVSGGRFKGGGLWGLQLLPHPKSQEHILTYVFQGYLTHDMAFNRMISICDESKTKYKLISLC
jgi:hypothetical protein